MTLKQRTPLKRKRRMKRGKVKPVNKARRLKEFVRCYGSAERVEWVRLRECMACGVEGFSENAHVLGNDGMGRKGDCKTIAPLCGTRFMTLGCHPMLDTDPTKFRERFPAFNAKRAARETQKAWEAYLEAAA